MAPAARVGRGRSHATTRALSLSAQAAFQRCWSWLSNPTLPPHQTPSRHEQEGSFSFTHLSLMFGLSSSAFATKGTTAAEMRGSLYLLCHCDASLCASRNPGAEGGSLQAHNPTPPPPRVSSSAEAGRHLPARLSMSVQCSPRCSPRSTMPVSSAPGDIPSSPPRR